MGGGDDPVRRDDATAAYVTGAGYLDAALPRPAVGRRLLAADDSIAHRTHAAVHGATSFHRRHSDAIHTVTVTITIYVYQTAAILWV